MEQQQPTPSVFSLASEIEHRQKQADERRVAWEQKRQRAADLYRDGQNPILAYINAIKPQQEGERVKRTQTAAKVAAWTNLLSALGTGIIGMATQGYIPKTGNDAPLRLLGKLDEWEKLYSSQNREYQQLRLRALMGQQQGAQQAANLDATAAGQDYMLAQKQYDTMVGNLWKAQQEKQRQTDELDAKLKVERLRGENSLKTAQVRASATAAAAHVLAGSAQDKAAVQFLDRDEKTVIRLNPAQESLLYEKGREMGIIPEDGTPTKQPAYTGEKVPQFVFGKLKPAQKAQVLRTVYLRLTQTPQSFPPQIDAGLTFRPSKRYVKGPLSPDTMQILETPQAEQMREAGYSDQQIINYYLDYE